MRFLNVNDFTLEAANGELYQFTVDVATSALSKDEVAAWIETKAGPLGVRGTDDN